MRRNEQFASCLVFAAVLQLLSTAQAQTEVAECFGEVEFIAVDETVDFDTAVTRCADREALVAGIVSDEEQDFVANLTNQLGIGNRDDLWIGKGERLFFAALKNS